MNASNKYRLINPNRDKFIDIPLEIKWDFSGRDDAIAIYEKTVIDEIIGAVGPYEISRYSHKEYGPDNLTQINYQFLFYNSSIPITATTIADTTSWVSSYLLPNANPSGFSVSQLYYFQKPFRNSFFKLDFYDTPDSRTQKNYFTIILPTQQGTTQLITLSPYIPPVEVKQPNMFLDFVGDKEGFFIYWLRTPKLVTIDTFYMSAKFFDARLGVWVRMTNEPQAVLPDKFIFDSDTYFFRKVKIDYITKKYEILDNLNQRIGDGTPIKWYEYINP